jgi:mRNA interferase RelE/StbE
LVSRPGKTYTVLLTASAARDLKKVQRVDQERIASAIDGLATDPRPHGHEKLQGAKDLYRVRSGDYRIIYRIDDKAIRVLVARIGHRRDVYRR